MPKKHAKPRQQRTVPQHFYVPRGTTKWSVRLIAPKRIQHLVKQKEFRKSTGHSELNAAKPVGFRLIAEKTLEWARLARSDNAEEGTPTPTVLSTELVEHICAARLYSWMRSDDEDRASPEGLDADALADIDSFCQLSDAAMRSVLAQGAASSHWRGVVETVLDWCCVLGYGVQKNDPMFIQLARCFAKVEKEAQHLIALRNAGEDVETPAAPKPLGHVLSDVTERFRAYKAPKARLQLVSAMLNAWTHLIGHCGDIPLDSVTPGLIFDFMDARLHARPRPWSERHAKTFGKRTLSEIFGYARTLGLMTAPNPVDAMEAFPSLTAAEEASRRNPRFPYTSKQLNTLLGSSWYDPADTTNFRGKMRNDLGARYWVPLLGIFHGTRVREPLQLVAGDFAYEDGIYVMSIRAELDEPSELSQLRSLKTDATKRRVPVHPQLLSLGLVDFVEDCRKSAGDGALLFPSSMPELGGKSPKLGRSYEQAFLRFVRDRLAFGPGLGNHGLRHQLEDRIRDTQARSGRWPAGLGQQYTGRKRTRTVDRDVLLDEGSEADYGFGYTPAAILRYIASIDFSDLSFPPPYAEWLKGGAQTGG